MIKKFSVTSLLDKNILDSINSWFYLFMICCMCLTGYLEIKGLSGFTMTKLMIKLIRLSVVARGTYLTIISLWSTLWEALFKSTPPQKKWSVYWQYTNRTYYILNKDWKILSLASWAWILANYLLICMTVAKLFILSKAQFLS